MPADQLKIEFAKRLQRAYVAKNWNQSDLARAVEAEMQKTDPKAMFGRDNISYYVRAKHFPRPEILAILCKVLGVPEEQLVPKSLLPDNNPNPPLHVQSLADGNVLLRINQAVSLKTALEIMAIIRKEHGD